MVAMGYKRRTASTVAQVRTWIETQQHHIANAEEPGFMKLIGYSEQLRIPAPLWAQCYISSAQRADHDDRMYRWDFEAEFRAAWPLSSKDALHKAEHAIDYPADRDAREFFGWGPSSDDASQRVCLTLRSPVLATDMQPRLDCATRLLREFNAKYHTVVRVRAIPYENDLKGTEPDRQRLELYIE